MVGEIRDAETANMAVQASLTGHLVLSTLHTNDAPSAVTRLHDLGIQPFLTSATLVGIVAQRLLRTLCPHCKKALNLSDLSAQGQQEKELAEAWTHQWQELVNPWTAKLPTVAYLPKGCEHCRHTGYQGRVGIYEMLGFSNAIKKMVAQNADLNQLKKQAYDEGMQPLRLAGAKKIAEGVTSIDEVLRVVPLN